MTAGRHQVTLWLDGQQAHSADVILDAVVAEVVRLMERRGLTYFGVRLEAPAPLAGNERLVTRGELLTAGHAAERAELEARHAADRQAFEDEVAVARQRAAMRLQAERLGGVEDLELPER